MKKYILLLLILFGINSLFSQNHWLQKNDFLHDYGGITSFSINGKGYIIRSENLELYSYNPDLDTYAQKNSLPFTTTNLKSFVINNEAYVLYSSYESNTLFVHIYKYNANEDSWLQMSSLNLGEDSFFAGSYSFSINDKGYVLFAGLENDNFREYDAINDTWTAKEHCPYSGFWSLHKTFSIGDRGYVAFNHDGFDFLPHFYSYSQETDSWSQLEDIPFNGPGMAGATFTIGDDGYLGIWGAIGSGAFYRYSQTDNSWYGVQSCPNSNGANFSYAINGMGYVGTSHQDTQNNRQVWMFSPDLSVNQNEYSNNILVFPNPTKNIINIESELTIDFYSILDLTGRKVMTSTKFNNKINVSTLNSRTYILKLENTESNSYHYFIKE